MTTKRPIVDLVRPLARKTALVATIAAFLLTLGTPLTLYIQLRGTRTTQAESYARRMASLVRDVVVSQPDLWTYDTPKLANHLRLLVEGVEVEQVVVIATNGTRINVPDRRRETSILWWVNAPVHRGSEEVARVWVAIDARPGLGSVVLILILAFLLGAALSTILYVVPVGVVGQAERRISTLLEKLESARQELTELNADLENRVALRSRQLADTAAALQESEARLREVAGRAVEATEQERQRVARELHDGVGQSLTAIRLTLHVLSQKLDENDDSRQRVHDVENLVDDSIDELRRIAMALHPAALDRLGLREGISEMCSSVATSAGIHIEQHLIDVPDSLPASVESSCYRLVQECLTNIVRYARATNVEVRIQNTGSALRVKVEDDGVGFDDSSPSEGLGLRSMKDRTALLGGTITIESTPGKGTTIEALLPMSHSLADE